MMKLLDDSRRRHDKLQENDKYRDICKDEVLTMITNR